MSTFYKPTTELYHYGVIGMKWGVRKASGYSRKEVRADKKRAFALGKEGTVSARAHSLAKNRVNKVQSKISKSESKGKDTTKLREKLKIAKDVERTTGTESKQARSAIDSHRNSLIKKYGSEHVSSIKTDKRGRVNEKVMTGKDFCKIIAMDMGIRSLAVAVGLPVAPVFVPQTKTKAATIRYNSRYRSAVKKHKGK